MHIFSRCQETNENSNYVESSIEQVYEQNKCLKSNIEILKKQLNDARRNVTGLESYNNQHSDWINVQNVQLAPTMHQREEMIQQLEKLNMKVCTRVANL